jgi:hypothetical protein
MAKATCCMCKGSHDTRSMTTCPECGGYLCNDCSRIYNGFCDACYDAGADQPDWP